ncbi:MAG TPA: thiamine-phosphate kinase [Leptospiraceae bacterium]|nr:thiamine-phosphate kinase [Leptospiraceae bacterium]HMX32493.1 thiamine-phosphate kinase [Leptospiraceae bacterium]HMY30227.1 thiamine-phosphate kinase [Leptospiraceae bacterium]HMZ66930.1 thiamine-phosphate kinase [Leptospiraceae bacterium]HNA07194.1 thiamine-phosphate kinase [Leptospiraceae bacterium]
MNEEKIIRHLYKNQSFDPFVDDCFWMDKKYLVTTDTMCEGTHFKHEWSSPKDLACKLVTLNVSDLFSSGGIPKYAFLNLGLSKISSNSKWLSSFTNALRKNLQKYNIILSGGDTYRSQTTNLNLTLIGTINHLIQRKGASVGDKIFITGKIGLSILGLKYLENNIDLPLRFKKAALKKHLAPEVRNLFAKNPSIYKNMTAMMDISDGLIQDANKLAKASNVHLNIHIEKIPFFVNYEKYLTIDDALNSGEEAEYLFTGDVNLKKSKFITLIGEVLSGNAGVSFLKDNKKYSPKEKGFLHF